MFAQIFLGIGMISVGFGHLLQCKALLSKKVHHQLSESELTSFQRGLVLPYFFLGVVFLIMAFVERKALFPTPIFLVLYLLLSSIPVAMVFINNKKHFGSYFP